MLAGQRASLESLDGTLNPAVLLDAQDAAAAVPANQALLDYVLDLLAASRRPEANHPPLSPRAGLGEQGGYAEFEERFRLRGAVGAPAVGYDDIHLWGGCLDAVELGSQSSVLVDDGND